MREIQLAIVGTGGIAREHARRFKNIRGCRLLAACDVDRSRAEAFAKEFSVPEVYSDFGELLARSAAEAVSIVASDAAHAPLTLKAVAAGRHVLCEKPLVRTLDELGPVAAHARAAGRVLHTVHNWHHAPIVRLADELVRAGQIGTPTRVVWHTLRTQPAPAGDGQGDNWRLDPLVAGGGVLSDHGWHVCYVLARLIGAWPTAVSARLETRRHTCWPVEDTAALEVTFPRATAEVLLTWAADERRNWAALDGDAGRIELHDDILVLTRGGREWRWPCPPLSNSSHHPDWFDAVADEFLAEMSGAAPSNFAEAGLCVTFESQARESSRRGGETLPLPPAQVNLPAHSESPI
jgi:predicted dehydrogenase